MIAIYTVMYIFIFLGIIGIISGIIYIFVSKTSGSSSNVKCEICPKLKPYKPCKPCECIDRRGYLKPCKSCPTKKHPTNVTGCKLNKGKTTCSDCTYTPLVRSACNGTDCANIHVTKLNADGKSESMSSSDNKEICEGLKITTDRTSPCTWIPQVDATCTPTNA